MLPVQLIKWSCLVSSVDDLKKERIIKNGKIRTAFNSNPHLIVELRDRYFSSAKDINNTTKDKQGYYLGQNGIIEDLEKIIGE